jgi:HEPN domain-containing protein
LPRDYKQAALRHYMDAESLAAVGRYDDAGHLIGLAAECALKHGIQGFTIPQNKAIEGHLPSVKYTIRTILNGRNAKPSGQMSFTRYVK